MQWHQKLEGSEFFRSELQVVLFIQEIIFKSSVSVTGSKWYKPVGHSQTQSKSTAESKETQNRLLCLYNYADVNNIKNLINVLFSFKCYQPCDTFPQRS